MGYFLLYKPDDFNFWFLPSTFPSSISGITTTVARILASAVCCGSYLGVPTLITVSEMVRSKNSKKKIVSKDSRHDAMHRKVKEIMFNYSSRVKILFLVISSIFIFSIYYLRQLELPNDAARAEIEIGQFLIATEDKDLVWMKNKIERNLTELFVSEGYTADHALASEEWKSPSRFKLEGTLEKNKSFLTITAKYTKDGVTQSMVTIEDSFNIFAQSYKSIPQAIVTGLKINLNTLETSEAVRSETRSLSAYALYIEARRAATFKKFEVAIDLLKKAVERDNDFASAYWTLGLVHLERGEVPEASHWFGIAKEINPDHSKIPLPRNVPDPLPSLLLGLLASKPTEISSGLAYSRLINQSYGIEIHFWLFDQDEYNFDIGYQTDASGSTVLDIRNDYGADFGVNGGFFEIDSDGRLTPSGLILINGKEVSNYNPAGGSGLIAIVNGNIRLEWMKNFPNFQPEISALQSGPMIVEPGGNIGIRSNDYNRLDRTAICEMPDGDIGIVIVKGGLSLFELAYLLSLDKDRGGYGCERAINLDGGPSSQASLSIDDISIDMTGLWKINNAILALQRIE